MGNMGTGREMGVEQVNKVSLGEALELCPCHET